MQLLVRGEVAALPLKGVIDVAAEKTRLDKEIAKADADIKRADSKLGEREIRRQRAEEVVEEETREARGRAGPQGQALEALERLKQRVVTPSGASESGMRIRDEDSGSARSSATMTSSETAC